MKRVTIEKLDNLGRGIAYVDNLICFIPKVLPTEIVDIKITNIHKNYLEGKLINIVKGSEKRILAQCPYSNDCGGCTYLNLTYLDSLNCKKEIYKELLKKNKLAVDLDIVSNIKNFNYRNKVSLKIENSIVGYYQSKTNNLVAINECLVANKEINRFIKKINYLDLTNASITIRCNYLNELLIVINTKEKYNCDISKLTKDFKIAGIIFNDKCVYQNNYFYEKINDLLFKVSYNSFFQINPYITSKLFEYLNSLITKDDVVVDLYSGVGTLSIVAAKKAQKVYSLEINENAIKDGQENSILNKVNNVIFYQGNVNKTILNITDKVNTIIIDPPRSGLDKKTMASILKLKANKIIYISCNPQTLIRDLLIFQNNYHFSQIKLFDMFSYSHHIESVCFLKKID